MRPDVVVQKERGEFVNANGFTAWKGFDERGMDAAFADWAAMDAGEVPADLGTIVVGSVAFVRRALGRLGIDPPPLDYPPSLARYLGREVRPTTWAEVRRGVDGPGGPVFVKPRGDDKAFAGYVVSAFRDLIPTAKFPGETPLWASDPVAFASEWRYFVKQGEVIGVGWYKGDPLRHPDPAAVRAAVADFAPDAPAAYGLDVGVTEAGATLLVECNDGFSLGCYGLPPLAYSRFLEERWRELTAGA